MASYDSYLAKAYKETEDEVNKLKSERQAITEKNIADYGATIDNQVAEVNAGYQKQIDDADGQYRGLYNENAIREIAARANLEEAMANAGMTDSGLNRTQMTAIATQRGNADANVRQQQMTFENNLRNAMAQVQAEAAAKKADYGNQMRLADEQWYYDAMLSGRKAAQETALGRYNAELQAQQAAVKAQQEAAKQQREYELQMLKLGYAKGTDGKYYKTAEDNASARDAYEQMLIKSAGYTPEDAREEADARYGLGTTQAQRTAAMNAYLTGGQDSLLRYAMSLGLSDQMTADFVNSITSNGVNRSSTNSKYSEKKYMKVGKDTTNGLFGLGTVFGHVDNNDTVAWLDENGKENTITLENLYNELINEGYSKSEARKAIEKFNKYDEENKKTYQTLF